jgi:hypothetical protein
MYYHMTRLALLFLVLVVPAVNSLIACAYRCDPQWEGLDSGACFNGDTCPDPYNCPDCPDVESICYGLPYQPGPGDILLHDAVLFDDQYEDDCEGYIDAWENKEALARRADLYVGLGRNFSSSKDYQTAIKINATAGDSDKVSFADRAQAWGGVVKSILGKCVGIGGDAAVKCKDWDHILKEGMDGGQVRDCLMDCAAMIGIEAAEDIACNGMLSATGPAAQLICNGVSRLLAPVNKICDKYVVQPVIKAADAVADAVGSAVKSVGHWFHFW